MKLIRQVSVALVVFVAASGWVKASVVEKPVTMPGAMVSVTVSDLHGFIDGVGSVAAQVSPMANGMMLKNMIGMQVGDPALSGIAPGKGLAVVAMDPESIFAVVEVSEAQVEAYTGALTANGVKAAFIEGVLVVSPDDAGMAKGAGLAASVKDTLLARRSPVMSIAAQPAALIAQNKAEIDGMLQMMPMMMGMGMVQQSPGMDVETAQSTARILEGELRVLLSVAEQCDSAEIVLAPAGGSLKITETFSAKPETRLAALLNAPKVNKPNPLVQAGLADGAAITLDCTLSNPDAMITFFTGEFDALLTAMNLQSEDVAGWDVVMKKSMKIYGGSFSESISLGGEQFMDICYVMDVKDEAAALDYLKTCTADMAPIFKLYQSLGMEMDMEFKENVREHKGVKIHQFKMAMKMSDEQMAAAEEIKMDLSNMVMDISIFNGLMLYTMGGTGMETLIDRLQDDSFKPAPVKARAVYPANGFYYCDVDVASYLAGIASITPEESGMPLAQVAAMLQGAEPVTSAGFSDAGMVMWSVNVPGSLLARIGQTVMTMQMQQMQGGPGAMPVETLEPIPVQ